MQDKRLVRLLGGQVKQWVTGDLLPLLSVRFLQLMNSGWAIGVLQNVLNRALWPVALRYTPQAGELGPPRALFVGGF